MTKDFIYSVMKAAVDVIRKEITDIKGFEETIQNDAFLADYGFDIVLAGDLFRDLENRFDGRSLHLETFLVPENFYMVTVGQVVNGIAAVTGVPISKPIVVYVDDEEENLFIFKRKFGKNLNLKLFGDPREALTFVNNNPDVYLVITDEVMPGLRGNQLCDEIHKVKPFMKFILITGNPENDNGLMYNSLRKNRFFEYIQKPVDFDGKKDEYLTLINNIIERQV